MTKLQKTDLIRINQLVRRGTDYTAFFDWYKSLQVPEQAALVGELCSLAYQAGVDDSIYESAAGAAELSHDKDFLILMKKVRGPSGLNVGGFVDWLRSVSDADRARAFKLFVHLFGEAERRVLQHEDKETCNHWWHRNLDDPRVVQSILNDPDYYKTSPRDDDALK